MRDLARFREFLSRFEQLDSITAQNPDNPKADHRVVRRELETFQARQPDLSAEELLYVLAWAGRLVPREAGAPPGQTTRRPVHREPAPRPPPPPPKSPGEALWSNVGLELWKGSPTIFRGKQTATCAKEDLAAPLLTKLRKLRGGDTLRVHARVVKKGGGAWRIDAVEEAEA